MVSVSSAWKIALVAAAVVLLPSCMPATASSGGVGSTHPPTAIIVGTETGTVGKVCQFSGTASVGATSYAWGWSSRPEGSSAVLESVSSGVTQFSPDVPGSYTLQLMVTNTNGTDATTKTLQVGVPLLPVVSAHASATIPVGNQVTLDGSGTTGAVSYWWTITARPPGSVATILSPTAAAAFLTPDLPGTYTIQLAATNGDGTSTATVTVTGTAGSIAVTVY